MEKIDIATPYAIDKMGVITPSASDFGVPNVIIKSFPDGDSYVQILNNIESDLANIFTRLHPNQNDLIIQTVFIARILKDAGVRNIHLYAPYLPYARQDKVWKKGEGLSARYVVELLRGAGINQITTLDCHFIKKAGEFDYWGMKIINKTASAVLIEEAKKHLSDPIVMSPDAGASYMSENFGGGHMNKVRGEYVEGKNAYREIKSLDIDSNQDVNGRNVLLVDDIIGSGGTMIRAINVLKKAGANRIGIVATHGFFLNNSLDKLKSAADVVLTTSSIRNETSKVDAFKLLVQ